MSVPDGIASGEFPSRAGLPGVSPGTASGGETAARKQLTAWLRSGIAAYADRHDDLAERRDLTAVAPSALRHALPVELAHRARKAGGSGAEAFVRQFAWRDFHRQVPAARPATADADHRTRHDDWRSAPPARTSRPGGRAVPAPLIAAAMRQLRHEGWMHNRGHLLTASLLTKTLYVDWRVGALHFLDLPVDGDLANNQLNWQWVAGTGTRPNRVLSPVAQGRRHDPDGAYVRRLVPELAGAAGAAVHEPWRLRGPDRAELGGYPDPVADLADGLARFRRARALSRDGDRAQNPTHKAEIRAKWK
ncbi:FAD-binding domain-containing protein [Streptomyces lasalocidi]